MQNPDVSPKTELNNFASSSFPEIPHFDKQIQHFIKTSKRFYWNVKTIFKIAKTNYDKQNGHSSENFCYTNKDMIELIYRPTYTDPWQKAWSDNQLLFLGVLDMNPKFSCRFGKKNAIFAHEIGYQHNLRIIKKEPSWI